MLTAAAPIVLVSLLPHLPFFSYYAYSSVVQCVSSERLSRLTSFVHSFYLSFVLSLCISFLPVLFLSFVRSFVRSCSFQLSLCSATNARQRSGRHVSMFLDTREVVEAPVSHFQIA